MRSKYNNGNFYKLLHSSDKIVPPAKKMPAFAAAADRIRKKLSGRFCRYPLLLAFKNFPDCFASFLLLPQRVKSAAATISISYRQTEQPSYPIFSSPLMKK